ncbi:hypothetical protein [Jeotgalibaca ciconiae]|uniref:Uncharacterized protein n=1 Tax=Jeotgalibaca ciconiae TaxID=2496265 RepID=A0A3S9HDF4_9LACT|nr:hypothetical protein [Jeotgalibaca ciconiae]AZP05405.1 hypothetical protein EJN90_12540 [Jeotgalibaca ciconiae]
MFNFLLTTIAAVTLFGFNDTEIPIEDVGENGNIIYLAPDLDLSTGTEEQIQTLRDIGWNLDSETYHRDWCSRWLGHNFIYHKHS